MKFTILKQPIDDTIGNSDMMPLWNLSRRDGTAYHWDGLSTSLREVVQSSALGDGATQAWMDRDFAKWDNTDPQEMSSLRRVMNYIGELKAPGYPLPVDKALAASGATAYAAHCAECHDQGAKRTGTVIPLDEIGTDRHRLDMWTAERGNRLQRLRRRPPVEVLAVSGRSNGYTATPLDGIWLTGPYLHNGSVPTLADLLEPAASRPAKFWRGYDVFDATKVGFVVQGPEAERVGTAVRHDAAWKQQRRP